MKTFALLLLLAGSSFADINPPPAPRAIPVDELETEIPTMAAPGCELPVTLVASSMLSPAERAGTAHRVREQVPTDGYMAHFTIDSDFGTFQAIGIEQVRKHIREIYAIRALVEVSRSDLFAEGLKRSIEQPVDAVKNIIKDPVGAVKTVPRTVGHFFKKVGNSIGSAATAIKEKTDGREGSAGEQARSAIKDLGKSLSRVGKGVIGFDSARLECARQLGVDPYTENELLQSELEKVSWVFFSGGMPLRLGAAAASGGASAALTAANFIGLPGEIYKATPAELNLRHQTALDAMGVPEAAGKAFAANPAMSLTVRHSILSSLEALHTVSGKPDVVNLATECRTSRQAEFLEHSLRILAHRQQANRTLYKELVVIGRLMGAVDTAGQLHIPAPLDYLSWTGEVAEFAGREDLSDRKPVLLTDGGASETAAGKLKAAGWSIAKP